MSTGKITVWHNVHANTDSADFVSARTQFAQEMIRKTIEKPQKSKRDDPPRFKSRSKLKEAA